MLWVVGEIFDEPTQLLEVATYSLETPELIDCLPLEKSSDCPKAFESEYIISEAEPYRHIAPLTKCLWHSKGLEVYELREDKASIDTFDQSQGPLYENGGIKTCAAHTYNTFRPAMVLFSLMVRRNLLLFELV
ncbi:hypothetical protein BFJ68_g10950 [Fusarium oxysporum]|uniref:Uncharacterized protein n=1 Tax=Fusarium oxysporum TaxID=5507 RepID=A0A420QAF6_FUSOX|nr:hypothetical protein BFJ71_g5079 [Fusarium oxysporum]RKL04557.1 hypothetical protein BFJ68_g10950 [Fusarium oxysporum]